MVEEGKPAPDFELSSDSGERVRLSSLRGNAAVLYCYPKDDTPGGTTQGCGLRDRQDEQPLDDDRCQDDPEYDERGEQEQEDDHARQLASPIEPLNPVLGAMRRPGPSPQYVKLTVPDTLAL